MKKHPIRHCKSCGYQVTWYHAFFGIFYPKGKDGNSQCPHCGAKWDNWK